MTKYGHRLPTGETTASVVKYLNERQRAEETSAASWWQRAFGNVPRKAAQDSASCDNIAQDNCMPDSPVDYVRILDTSRLGTEDHSECDALYAAGLLKQFTWIRIGWNDPDLIKSSMEYMAEKYPGVPQRNIRWAMDFSNGGGHFEEL